MADELSGSEAVFGFCGWLTTRKATVTMSSSADCAPVVDLIKQFCEAQQLAPPRDGWNDRLVTMPVETVEP